MRIKKIVPLLIGLFAIPFLMNAQVTTSNMNGSVKNLKGEVLAGATISAVHQPTGTVYTTSSKNGGNYYIANMNPGGPYAVTVSYVGYKTISRDAITLDLGETSVQNFNLGETTANLAEVVVASTRGAASGGKGGAETGIGWSATAGRCADRK